MKTKKISRPQSASGSKKVSSHPRDDPNKTKSLAHVGSSEDKFCCIICYEEITNNSVRLECDCRVKMCTSCALGTIAARKDTYLNGLKCPTCPKYSKIRGIEACLEVEQELIDSAINHFNIRQCRSDDGSRSLLRAFIESGYQGTIPLADLDSDRYRNDKNYAPMIRLDVARLEQARLDGVDFVSPYKGSQLPLGPLALLAFEHDQKLEHAIQKATKNKKKTLPAPHQARMPLSATKSAVSATPNSIFTTSPTMSAAATTSRRTTEQESSSSSTKNKKSSKQQQRKAEGGGGLHHAEESETEDEYEEEVGSEEEREGGGHAITTKRAHKSSTSSGAAGSADNAGGGRADRGGTSSQAGKSKHMLVGASTKKKANKKKKGVLVTNMIMMSNKKKPSSSSSVLLLPPSGSPTANSSGSSSSYSNHKRSTTASTAAAISAVASAAAASVVNGKSDGEQSSKNQKKSYNPASRQQAKFKNLLAGRPVVIMTGQHTGKLARIVGITPTARLELELSEHDAGGQRPEDRIVFVRMSHAQVLEDHLPAEDAGSTTQREPLRRTTASGSSRSGASKAARVLDDNSAAASSSSSAAAGGKIGATTAAGVDEEPLPVALRKPVRNKKPKERDLVDIYASSFTSRKLREAAESSKRLKSQDGGGKEGSSQPKETSASERNRSAPRESPPLLAPSPMAMTAASALVGAGAGVPPLSKKAASDAMRPNIVAVKQTKSRLTKLQTIVRRHIKKNSGKKSGSTSTATGSSSSSSSVLPSITATGSASSISSTATASPVGTIGLVELNSDGSSGSGVTTSAGTSSVKSASAAGVSLTTSTSSISTKRSTRGSSTSSRGAAAVASVVPASSPAADALLYDMFDDDKMASLEALATAVSEDNVVMEQLSPEVQNVLGWFYSVVRLVPAVIGKRPLPDKPKVPLSTVQTLVEKGSDLIAPLLEKLRKDQTVAGGGSEAAAATIEEFSLEEPAMINVANEVLQNLIQFVDAAEVLEQETRKDIIMSKKVLALQDGHLEKDATKQNLMEKRLWQVLEMRAAQFNEDDTGIYSPYLQSLRHIISSLEWCGRSYDIFTEMTKDPPIIPVDDETGQPKYLTLLTESQSLLQGASTEHIHCVDVATITELLVGYWARRLGGFGLRSSLSSSASASASSSLTALGDIGNVSFQNQGLVADDILLTGGFIGGDGNADGSFLGTSVTGLNNEGGEDKYHLCVNIPGVKNALAALHRQNQSNIASRASLATYGAGVSSLGDDGFLSTSSSSFAARRDYNNKAAGGGGFFYNQIGGATSSSNLAASPMMLPTSYPSMSQLSQLSYPLQLELLNQQQQQQQQFQMKQQQASAAAHRQPSFPSLQQQAEFMRMKGGPYGMHQGNNLGASIGAVASNNPQHRLQQSAAQYLLGASRKRPSQQVLDGSSLLLASSSVDMMEAGNYIGGGAGGGGDDVIGAQERDKHKPTGTGGGRSKKQKNNSSTAAAANNAAAVGTTSISATNNNNNNNLLSAAAIAPGTEAILAAIQANKYHRLATHGEAQTYPYAALVARAEHGFDDHLGGMGMDADEGSQYQFLNSGLGDRMGSGGGGGYTLGGNTIDSALGGGEWRGASKNAPIRYPTAATNPATASAYLASVQRAVAAAAAQTEAQQQLGSFYPSSAAASALGAGLLHHSGGLSQPGQGQSAYGMALGGASALAPSLQALQQYQSAHNFGNTNSNHLSAYAQMQARINSLAASAAAQSAFSAAASQLAAHDTLTANPGFVSTAAANLAADRGSVQAHSPSKYWTIDLQQQQPQQPSANASTTAATADSSNCTTSATLSVAEEVPVPGNSGRTSLSPVRHHMPATRTFPTNVVDLSEDGDSGPGNKYRTNSGEANAVGEKRPAAEELTAGSDKKQEIDPIMQISTHASSLPSSSTIGGGAIAAAATDATHATLGLPAMTAGTASSAKSIPETGSDTWKYMSNLTQERTVTIFRIVVILHRLLGHENGKPHLQSDIEIVNRRAQLIELDLLREATTLEEYLDVHTLDRRVQAHIRMHEGHGSHGVRQGGRNKQHHSHASKAHGSHPPVPVQQSIDTPLAHAAAVATTIPAIVPSSDSNPVSEMTVAAERVSSPRTEALNVVENNVEADLSLSQVASAAETGHTDVSPAAVEASKPVAAVIETVSEPVGARVTDALDPAAASAVIPVIAVDDSNQQQEVSVQLPTVEGQGPRSESTANGSSSSEVSAAAANTDMEGNAVANTAADCNPADSHSIREQITTNISAVGGGETNTDADIPVTVVTAVTDIGACDSESSDAIVTACVADSTSATCDDGAGAAAAAAHSEFVVDNNTSRDDSAFSNSATDGSNNVRTDVDVALDADSSMNTDTTTGTPTVFLKNAEPYAIADDPAAAVVSPAAAISNEAAAEVGPNANKAVGDRSAIDSTHSKGSIPSTLAAVSSASACDDQTPAASMPDGPSGGSCTVLAPNTNAEILLENSCELQGNLAAESAAAASPTMSDIIPSASASLDVDELLALDFDGNDASSMSLLGADELEEDALLLANPENAVSTSVPAYERTNSKGAKQK